MCERLTRVTRDVPPPARYLYMWVHVRAVLTALFCSLQSIESSRVISRPAALGRLSLYGTVHTVLERDTTVRLVAARPAH